MKENEAEAAEGKDHKKKRKALGVELKNYLMSIVPHIESTDIKYSTSKGVMVPAKEVLQWSHSLEKLLATSYGRDVFREFLKSEFSEENIEFWLACEDYKKTQADHLCDKAEKIYKEFIQCDAIKQVNIDFQTRKTIAKMTQDPTSSGFDEAQRLVYILMERDSYPRFLKSKFYHNLLNNGRCNNFM